MTLSEFALSYLDVKQGSNQHKYIVDVYNCILPLPRGYKVSYTDSWCAVFVSFCMKQMKAINAPYECSCIQMFKNGKQINKSEANTNDIIFYDWDGNGTYDHVGIIYDTDNKYFYVVEGNKSKKVGTRKVSRNSKSIVGFIRVELESQTDSYYDRVVTDVIKGLYGNGLTRKHKIEAMGLDYNIVQNLVNERLKK